jgi:hypothetical protein
MARVRRVGATVIPALAVLAVRLIFFPMPFGVVLQGVIVGLLGALVAVGMALIYRADRVLNFAQLVPSRHKSAQPFGGAFASARASKLSAVR